MTSWFSYNTPTQKLQRTFALKQHFLQRTFVTDYIFYREHEEEKIAVFLGPWDRLANMENAVDKKDYKWYHNGIILVCFVLLHPFSGNLGVFGETAGDKSDNKW